MRVFGALILILVTSGCATITRGTEEAFAIQSNPPGATARLSNGLTCVTPCSIKVKRRGDFTVKIEKEGYETVEASVTSSIDGAGGAGMAGNVILGGLIGAGVDAGTGAMHSHKPNPLSVTMVKIVESQSAITPVSSSAVNPLGLTAVSNTENELSAEGEESYEEENLDPLDMGAKEQKE